jgi:ABC-type antimicrobial peptide transport system permease subunit
VLVLIEDDSRSLVPMARVTPGMFRLLGLSASTGRLFGDADGVDGAEPVVVLSDGFWRERFGGNPRTVGHTIAISGELYRIIGVARSGFAFPDRNARMWTVLTIPRPVGPPQNPRFMTFFAVARLSPNATPLQAAAEATAIARTIDPKPLAARVTFGDGGAAFVRATPMLAEVTSGIETSLVAIAAGIVCIVLIVCVNVANLLLSRGVDRQRELAVRKALGASWVTLARHQLTEALLLSAAGGVLGLILAGWAIRVLPALAPKDFPRIENVAVDSRSRVV